ncbi:hypothetical protein QTP88_001555 [Uroleucon formosanum]
MKHHLFRALGNANFTYEELNTILIRVEACLNSRPLVSLSTDPSDITPLTPAHFLIGDSLSVLPEIDVSLVPTNRISRWRRVMQVSQKIWSRWNGGYLTQLQERKRWSIEKGPRIKIGSIVLVKDDNAPPLQWKLGLVQAFYVDANGDGVPRVATVKIPSGVYRRAFRYQCPLPFEGALKSISDAVKKYKNVQIVALQEVRWPGERDMRTNGMTLFYSGSSNGKHENGVGFLVNDQLLPSIKKFTPVNDRICHIRIAGKQYDIILICVYSPTETGEGDLKDMFYDELERVYNCLSGHCLKIILGDFNSQVGRETIYRPTIGSESIHDLSNGNGTRLVEFAIANGLIVSSSFFPRKNINKYTWTSPGGIYHSQIDHVLVDKVHRSCIKDVRSKRGADGDSDHFLVLDKVKLILPNHWKAKRKKTNTTRFDVDKLGEESILQQFQQGIKDALDIHTNRLEEHSEVQTAWEIIKSSVLEVADNMIKQLPRDKAKHWFNQKCAEVIKLRNDARLEMMQYPTQPNVELYVKKRKEAHKVLRQEKRKMEKEKIEKLESYRYNPKEFFRQCKSLKNGFKPTTQFVLNGEGVLLSNSKDKAEEFRKYFDQLLNSEPNLNQGEDDEEWGEPTNNNLRNEELEPNRAEIESIIKSLKNNEAAGEDRIAQNY